MGAHNASAPVQATTLLTIGKDDSNPSVKTLPDMKKARVYGNAVVLPDGKVHVTGGASNPKEFSDEYALFQPGAPLAPGPSFM
jgi:galactose oxidase